MVKPRQEFLGTITKLAEDGSGIIDGYGAEIHNLTMVLNQRVSAPSTGTGRGSFWVNNDTPMFTDSQGNTINLGSGGSGNLGSGTATLADGYIDILTTIPVDAQILYSLKEVGGVPGQIQITNQTTSGFTIQSTSHYDTSIINWIWIQTSTIINNSLFANNFLFAHNNISESSTGSLRNMLVSDNVPGIGCAQVTIEENKTEWLPVVVTDGKEPKANQVLWNNGVNNTWTDSPKVNSLSITNGTSIGPGNVIRFETSTASIGFTSNTNGPGNNLSISAQNSKRVGGNLNLSSGTGQTIGTVNIQAGGVDTAIIGPGYIKNNGAFYQGELSYWNDSDKSHIIQGFDGRIAAKLLHNYGAYTIVPRSYAQSNTNAPHRDSQFGSFIILKEGPGGNVTEQVLSFSSTILGTKAPASRKITGTFLIGYSRINGAGSSAMYLIDVYINSSGNVSSCSLGAIGQIHNGNENDVLISGTVSSDSTFDIIVTRPDSAEASEVVNYYWEINYGWA